MSFSRRQALVLGVGVGLFLSLLFTTFVALKLMPLTRRASNAPSVAAVPAGPILAAPPATAGRGRFQLNADEVNLAVPLAPGVAGEGLAAGEFVEVNLSWRPAGEAPMQATLPNIEVVAVDPPAPPERPLAVATLRLKRRDAEQYSRRRVEQGFQCRLVASRRKSMNAPPPKIRVLFLCVENSNRSQMAEAFARLHGGDRVEAHSAGSQPSGKVSPKAIAAMAAKGIDLSVHRSKGLADLPPGHFDVAVTMGCGDACPVALAKRRIDWQIPDPKTLPSEEVDRVRDLIEAKVKGLLGELGS